MLPVAANRPNACPPIGLYVTAWKNGITHSPPPHNPVSGVSQFEPPQSRTPPPPNPVIRSESRSPEQAAAPRAKPPQCVVAPKNLLALTARVFYTRSFSISRHISDHHHCPPPSHFFSHYMKYKGKKPNTQDERTKEKILLLPKINKEACAMIIVIL